MRHPNNLKEQTSLRRELRNEGTAAEATLWKSLKGRQIEGLKWRRQFGIGPYILDFYCPSLHLCIELDGAHHYTLQGGINDLQREEWLLQEHGIHTIRIENKDIFDCHDEVIETIRRITKEILSDTMPNQPPSAPLR